MTTVEGWTFVTGQKNVHSPRLRELHEHQVSSRARGCVVLSVHRPRWGMHGSLGSGWCLASSVSGTERRLRRKREVADASIKVLGYVV